MRWLKPTTWLGWLCRQMAAQHFWVVLLVAVAGALLWHGVWRVCEEWAWQQQAWAYYAGMLGVWLAYGLQFAWPVGIFGCGMWGRWQKFRAQKVFRQLKFKPDNGFNDVSWQDFEVLVAELFRRQGFKVQLQGGDRADGGIDVIVKRDGGTYLVQCKHWKAQSVGVKVVRELYGVVAAEGMDGGYVITSGYFTPDAVAFAKGIAMKLINGRQLAQIMSEQTDL